MPAVDTYPGKRNTGQTDRKPFRHGYRENIGRFRKEHPHKPSDRRDRTPEKNTGTDRQQKYRPRRYPPDKADDFARPTPSRYRPATGKQHKRPVQWIQPSKESAIHPIREQHPEKTDDLRPSSPLPDKRLRRQTGQDPEIRKSGKNNISQKPQWPDNKQTVVKFGRFVYYFSHQPS